jgi:hypothetical protein
MDALIHKQQRHVIEWFRQGHKVIVRFWRLKNIEPPDSSDAFIRAFLAGATTFAVACMPPGWLLRHTDGVEMLDEKLNEQSIEALPPPLSYSFNLGFPLDPEDWVGKDWLAV